MSIKEKPTIQEKHGQMIWRNSSQNKKYKGVLHIQKIKGYSSFCIIKKKKENSNGIQISPIRLAKVRKVESTLSVVTWLRDRKQILWWSVDWEHSSESTWTMHSALWPTSRNLPYRYTNTCTEEYSGLYLLECSL